MNENILEGCEIEARKMLCNKCFFHDLEEKVCAKGHPAPKEGEECSSFTPHVAIDFFYEDGVRDKVQRRVEKNRKITLLHKLKTK